MIKLLCFPLARFSETSLLYTIKEGMIKNRKKINLIYDYIN